MCIMRAKLDIIVAFFHFFSFQYFLSDVFFFFPLSSGIYSCLCFHLFLFIFFSSLVFAFVCFPCEINDDNRSEVH